VLKSPYAIAALVVFFGIFYAIYDFNSFYNEEIPRMQAERRNAETELARREAELKRLQNFAQNIETVKQEVRELNLQLESALESMPRSFNLSGLLRKLNLLAQNSGVDLSSFTPKTSEPAAGAKSFYSTIGIEFTMSGSFTQTLVFLDQITRLKRIINIDSLRMSSHEDADKVGAPKSSMAVVSTNATIETYRFSE